MVDASVEINYKFLKVYFLDSGGNSSLIKGKFITKALFEDQFIQAQKRNK